MTSTLQAGALPSATLIRQRHFRWRFVLVFSVIDVQVSLPN